MQMRMLLWMVAIGIWAGNLNAQDKFCKTWYTQEHESKVRIYLAADGKYYGKIVWMRDSLINGMPILDKKNPDESKRSQNWLGMQIISGLTKKSETEIVNGKIYDPTKGNYYSCKMTLVGNKLELRGYILGMPFLGRTTTWYLAEDEQPKQNIPSTVPQANQKPAHPYQP